MRREARAALRELGLIALAAFAYVGVRAITEGRTEVAVANGRRILRLERTLHLDWEQALQAPILGHPLLMKLANDVYIWGFWPVLAAAAVYLYVGHRDRYVVLRDAIFVSALIGFAFFAFLPVAPPRLVDPHLVDTIRAYSPYYRPVEFSDVTNRVRLPAQPPLRLEPARRRRGRRREQAVDRVRLRRRLAHRHGSGRDRDGEPLRDRRAGRRGGRPDGARAGLDPISRVSDRRARSPSRRSRSGLRSP